MPQIPVDILLEMDFSGRRYFVVNLWHPGTVTRL
jgi:hypothetical protein